MKKNLSGIISLLEKHQIDYKIVFPSSENLNGAKQLNCSDELTFSHISYNSREVKNDTFFICKGAHFKKEYLADAIAKGATAYLSSQEYASPIPGIIVQNIREVTFLLAEFFYDYPQKDLEIIGITGTKGKSTATILLSEIFKANAKLYQVPTCGVISTIFTYDGEEEKESALTTPEPLELMQILFNCRKNGLRYVIIEASSQALKYDRLMNIEFCAALFLNISPDHISPIEHPNFEDYFSSKLKIFEHTKVAFVDAHLLENAHIAEACSSVPTITFSISDQADFSVRNLTPTMTGLELTIASSDDEFSCHSRLAGEFNAANIIAAVSVARYLNIPVPAIQKAISQTTVPGRMELFANQDKSIFALVDFAHNKLSFEKVYEYAHKVFPNSYIITVFGSVGGKAENRRYDLGYVSGKNSNYCILTDDNSYTEDIRIINQEIIAGLNEFGCDYTEVDDRIEAIQTAISLSKEHKNKTGQNVLMLILGRGIENTIKIKGKTIPFPKDTEIVQQYLN